MSESTDIYKISVLVYTGNMGKNAVKLSSELIDSVTPFLNELGLTNDQVNAYLYLLHLGKSSVMNLSSAMGSGRTRLYPILESLVDLQIVKVDQQHYGTTYEALNPASLDFLVTKKETEAHRLRNEIDNITEKLTSLSGTTNGVSKVIEYRGIDGLKQINFNQTKAQDYVYVYELAHLDEHETMPQSFVDRMRRMTYENNITTYDLSNNKDWEFVRMPTNPKGLFQKASYIPKEIFEIKVETYVYNDVIAYLGYDKDEPFGIEIYNKELVEQQKQIFKILWSMGTEVKNCDV
jgi:predicted transcriptional regulator